MSQVKKRKIDFDILESLRGVAALYVCIGHSRGVLWIGGEYFQQLHPRNTWSFLDYITVGLNMLTRLSTEFVIVFFVLSGFSIAHSLRNNSGALGFYKRRFIRLYPPYVVALLWAMGVGLLLWHFYPNFFDGTYGSAAGYHTQVFDRLSKSKGLYEPLTFLQNMVYLPQRGGLINPFWSLTFEVIFYLLAPFMLMKRKIYYSVSIIGYLIVATGFLFFHWPHNVPLGFIYYNIFFVIGVALYHNFEAVVSALSILVSKASLLIIPAIFFLMIGVSLTKIYVINNMLAGVLSCSMIIYLLTNNLRIKPLISIGRFSYTLYITHFPTIFLYLGLYYFITKSTSPYITNNLVFIPCVFLCLAVAWVHYQLVEKRTKSILDRMRDRNIAKRNIATPTLDIQTPSLNIHE